VPRHSSAYLLRPANPDCYQGSRQRRSAYASRVVKEGNVRLDDILDRELKIAEREREISRREETVNRREHDASRREAWIMEQLMCVTLVHVRFTLRLICLPFTYSALGGESAVEEEYMYEQPVSNKRRPAKVPSPFQRRSEL